MKKALFILVPIVAFVLISNHSKVEAAKNTPIAIVSSTTPGITPGTTTSYANEQAVTIQGYTGDSMEPSISRDGKYLFWNSLNDAKDTSLYYARRLNDTTFEYVGQVEGVNGVKPHLDAVASLGLDNEFYWVSLRNYPKVIENYQHGHFNNGVVTTIAPVKGDFYKRESGWLIMDAEISPDGQTLVYADAKFTFGPLPSDSIMGIARKSGDTFVKDKNSDIIFQNINAKGVIGYAPSYSADGRTLLFTRLVQGATKIYVSTRGSESEPFGKPSLVDISGNLNEAASQTYDGKKIYYHKKVGSTYNIFMMTKVN